MGYSILQTTPYNLVNNSESIINPLPLNNNTIKQTPKNKIGHIIREGTNSSNIKVNVLSTKPLGYCNEKCPKCGLDICICKCS